MEAGNTEPAEGTTAAIYEHVKHFIELLWVAVLAPLVDVDFLPAVGAQHCPRPRFADPRNDGEDLLKREVAEDEAQGIGDELLPRPRIAPFSHVVGAERNRPTFLFEQPVK